VRTGFPERAKTAWAGGFNGGRDTLDAIVALSVADGAKTAHLHSASQRAAMRTAY